MSANMGPYLARLQLAQRNKENLAGAVGGFSHDLTETMFALSELNREKSKDKLELLTKVGAAYGWEKAPQGLVNEWGGAIEAAAGGKLKMPRDPEGNVVPPPADAGMDPAERAYLSTLSPEEKQAHYKRKFGDLPKAGAEDERFWKNYWEGEKLRIQEARNAVMASKEVAGSDMRQPSGYVVGDDGRPRKAGPGERSLTYDQIKGLSSVMNWTERDLKNDLTKARTKAINGALEAGGPEGKMLQNVANAFLRTKDMRGLQVFWSNNLRPYMLRQGVDIGDPPDPPSMIEQVKHAVLGTPYSRSKGTAPAAQPKIKPEEVSKLISQREAAVAKGDYREAARLSDAIDTARGQSAGGGPVVTGVQKLP